MNEMRKQNMQLLASRARERSARFQSVKSSEDAKTENTNFKELEPLVYEEIERWDEKWS